MNSRLFPVTVLVLVTAFLIGPFFIIVAASLSGGETLAFPPQGLSLKWVAKVFEVESFRESFTMSMLLAIGGTAAALTLGIPASYALSRYRLPFGETLRTVVSLPIIVPGVIAGAIFAFITSWDEVVVSIFLTSALFRTLPVQMWEQVRTAVDPTVAAVATTLFVVTTVLLVVLLVVRRPAAFR